MFVGIKTDNRKRGFDMNNTKKAFRKFYLESHYDSLGAKLTFPFFYRKLLKWLGEIPGEPDESIIKEFLQKKNITLVIPLEKRVIILLWTVLPDGLNTVKIVPKEMVKQGVMNEEAWDWYWKNKNRIIFNEDFPDWEKIVWKSK